MSGSPIVAQLGERLQSYRKHQLTGIVRISTQNKQQWYLYYILGRIVWTKSRTHSLRRWQRHLAIHSPVFFEQIEKPIARSYNQWNYSALARLVKLKQFRRDRFCKTVAGCIREDIFDILYMGTEQHRQTGQLLAYEPVKKQAATVPFIMLQQEIAWKEAQQDWLTWQSTGLAKVSPDRAPEILQLQTLKEQTSEKTFQALTKFVDGQSTFRDLSNTFRQPLIPLTKSFLPYASRRILAVVEIPDIVEGDSDGFDPELQPTELQPTELQPTKLNQHSDKQPDQPSISSYVEKGIAPSQQNLLSG